MEFIDEPNVVRQYANVFEFKTILLVDDDQQLAESLQWILADESFVVDVAHDGDEAMLKVSANRYDAVVCDIMMPHMRGTISTAKPLGSARNSGVASSLSPALAAIHPRLRLPE
jgi:PleD family two-component response regulator